MNVDDDIESSFRSINYSVLDGLNGCLSPRSAAAVPLEDSPSSPFIYEFRMRPI